MIRLNDATPQEWNESFNAMLEGREGASKRPFGIEVPAGYENANMALGPGNIIVLAHPGLHPMFYDEHHRVWVPLTAST